MIQIQLTELIIIYLFLLIGALFTLWIGGEWYRKKRERLRTQHEILCHICRHHYKDTSTDPLSRCPLCNSLNERQKVLKL